MTPDSIWYWHNEVDDPHQPKTVKLEWPHWQDLLFVVDEPHTLDRRMEEVREAVDEVGGPPAFLRTPYRAGKFFDPDDPKITDADSVHRAVRAALRDHGQHMLPKIRSLAIREWVEIQSDGLPYPLEWRFLVRNDGQIGAHFDYYFGRDGSHNREPPPEVFSRAREAAKGLEPYDGWSVDFACDTDGTWWLIDMAEAANSGRPDWVDCNFADVSNQKGGEKFHTLNRSPEEIMAERVNDEAS